ncbi:MAG TPA: hypothetical protein VMU06_22350 [Stellaceae bacterium]|nr:hypothetical protein [Stellaceae bacterium]
MNITKVTDPTGFKQLPHNQWPADCLPLLQPVPAGGNPYSGAQTPWTRLNPTSRKVRLQSFAVFLDWLMRTGRYDSGRPVTKQVTRNLAEAYDVDMAAAKLSYYTRGIRLSGIYAGLRELAPKGEWRWLQQVAKECERLAKETRELPAFQPLPIDLVRAGLTYLQRSEAPGLSDRKRATLFRDGTIIIFFALVGQRRGAVAVMLLGEHLKTDEPTWLVDWPPEDIKGKRHGHTQELPDELVRILRRYLEVHRPVLLQRAEKVTPVAARALWLSERGTPLCESAIYKRHRHVSKDILGIAVNPQAVRHAGATFIAKEHPELVAIIAEWLGHTNGRTAPEHYILETNIAVSRRFVGAIDKMRFGVEAPSPAQAVDPAGGDEVDGPVF